MVRSLAALLGGELHIADRTDGVRGTAFWLTLPLRAPAPGTVDIAAQAAATPARDAALLRDGRSGIIMKRNVLVVDDIAGNRRLLRRMLQQLGCRVIEAGDGDEVLVALAAAVKVDGRGVDIVLMDIEMPRVDGLAALRGMRREGWTMPVIATTGYATTEDATRCVCTPCVRGATRVDSSARARAADVSSGFGAVLVKPFSRDRLRDLLLAECAPRQSGPLKSRKEAAHGANPSPDS